MRMLASILFLLPMVCSANSPWYLTEGYETAAADTSLVLHLTFDSGGTDSSLYGNDGVLVGSASVSGGYMTDPDNGSHLAVSNVIGMVSNAGTFSVAIHPTATSYGRLIRHRPNGGSGTMLYVSTLQMSAFHRQGATFRQISEGLNFSPNSNIVYSMTWDADADELLFYANGIEVARSTLPLDPISPLPSHIELGARDTQDFGQSGYYDNVRVYNRALKSNELYTIAQEANDLP